MSDFICGICGTEHRELGDYMKCVTKCGEKALASQKAEEEKKRLEKMNAALNRVKEAKKYFEEQLAKFEKEYPAEYKLNFGKKDKCKGDCKCSNDKSKSDVKTETIELAYKTDKNGKPNVTAKLNGKDVTDEALTDLLNDPETRFIAQMLGLI